MHTKILFIVCLTFGYAAFIVNAASGENDKTKFCDRLAPKHCDNDRVKEMCKAQCGGEGGEGEPAKPAEDEPTTKAHKSEEKTTKASPTTTKKASSGKKQCDKVSPCLSKQEANNNFRQRCSQLEWTNPGCIDHCNYDEGAAELKPAFTKGPCKLTELRQYLKASANNKDNSGCCQKTGVADFKGGLCMAFCNPAGPFWPGKGEGLKYAPCVGVLNGIQNCHYFAEGA
jgi:hypothetical protein